ncbi:putative replication protein E1 [Ovis aries papillomavirus 3]|uniref:Replication protein E1 n=1 Tax=Ovis aries papillomavirus 3 TaxID=634772 RepID=D5FL27_9PAPI|nr:putative replication protein E1 [Ovis aries papillomavirus 3]ACO58658.1 putative replication protein E1 [Ovis aries papillomavirus 3]
MESKGTSGNWFILREADCSSDGSGDELELSTESDISELIDNSEQCQENSLQLYQQQESEQHERNLCMLKRKFTGSPKKRLDCDLSPSFREIHITPEKHPPKRRLFQPDDSGIDLNTENEAETVDEAGTQVTVSAETASLQSPPLGRREDPERLLAEELLRSSNRRAVQLGIFKQVVGVGFGELTRQFKSDQTCAGHWVCAGFGVLEEVYEAFKQSLKPLVTYYNVSRFPFEKGSVTLILATFKVNKSRATVQKLMKTLLQVEDYMVVSSPPRLRSAVTACFWFRRGFTSTCTTYGEMPEWLKKQILVSHQSKEEATFSLTAMVQWAWDNEVCDEATAAYEYAKLCNDDSNAAAFLNSNNQPKHVKDCIAMVRMYRTAEMRGMTMSAWISRRAKKIVGEGSWKDIVNFLRYQSVEMPVFIGCLRACLKKVPKKTCLVIAGPSDTGKSTFLLSLMRFMQGAVLSFVNYRSHFWISPLAHCKVALIDDATPQCWDYLDTYMRNALDGTEISLDLKHRNHQQIVCPPLFISTNCDLQQEDKWKYLRSRLSLFTFANKFPLDDSGNPLYVLNEANWKAFFLRLWSHLELSDQEEDSDGEAKSPFRRAAGRDS